MAASQKDWAVAIDYFDQARRVAPLQPQPLYYLGLAETQIPGRELRAIVWLEVFLALVPQDAEATNVRQVISEMEVRVRKNLVRVRACWNTSRTRWISTNIAIARGIPSKI